MLTRGARRLPFRLRTARGRAVGVLVASLAMFGLWGVALAGSASAATTKSCSPVTKPFHAWDITASGVSCHYVTTSFLRAWWNNGAVNGWTQKVKTLSTNSRKGYYLDKVTDTKGTKKVTFRYHQLIGG